VQRTVSRRELIHEELGEAFADALSEYDTTRRMEVLIDEFLPDAAVAGQRALDVGSGLGFFSERLMQRGADVTACDIGENLLAATRRRAHCAAVVADALNLAHHFGVASFDLVVSSECIEHTPDPPQAIREMLAVLKPGGFLALSTPNLLWSPIVRSATRLGLRPFDGLENFSSWNDIRRTINGSSATIVREKGLHLFPFQLPLHRLSRWCDERLQPLRFAMINICVLARKH
jgi:2-polyprenyl-3-methyl-5-hydroxy-6-metoxy-1,4-benzoquinol methylase